MSSAGNSLEKERHSHYFQGVYCPKEKEDSDPIMTYAHEGDMPRSEGAEKGI